MTTKKVSVEEQGLTFNQKLKNVKLQNFVDSAVVLKAEGLVERSKTDFQRATSKDFKELKENCSKFEQTTDYALVENIQAKAFSIKSRAATGGFPLASDVAKSLFEYCEKATQAKTSIIKVHVTALDEIFSSKFDVVDVEKSTKLLAGLNKLVQIVNQKQ